MPELAKLQAVWLESFVGVAKSKKRTAVAADLCMRQADLTKHIGKLEDWLGLLLIYPGSLPPKLTEDGEAFLPIAENALEALRPVARMRRFPRPDISEPRAKPPARKRRGRLLRRPQLDQSEIHLRASQAALLVPPPVGGKDDGEAHEPDGDDRR